MNTAIISIPISIVIFALLPVIALLHGQFALAIVLALLPVGLMSFTKRSFIVMASIALYFSGFQLPGAPINLDLYQVFLVLFCANAVLSLLTSRQGLAFSRLFPVTIFALWILILIQVRGLGLNIVGGSLAGGAPYIHILIALCVYLFAQDMNLSARQWLVATSMMIVFVVVQIVLTASVILTHGRFWYPLLLVKSDFRFQQNFLGFNRAPEMTRWMIFGPLVYVNLLPVIYWSLRRFREFYYYAFFFVASLAFAFISGFRVRVLYVVIFAYTYIVLKTKKPILMSLLLLLGASLSLGTLALVGEHLPFGAQRVLSIVPWARVTPEAQLSAELTIRWRRALWSLAIENLPQYLFIGRGFAYNLGEYLQAARATRYGSIWRDVYPSYIGAHMHQGLLDLVFFLGIPGACIFILWLIRDILRHIAQQNRRSWNSVSLRRIHLAFTIFLITNAIGFLIFGNPIQYELPNILFQMALLMGVIASDEKLVESEAINMSD